jgi:hypothetical protein
MVGYPHLRTCIMVKKTVRLRFVVEANMDVPYCMTKEQIIARELDSQVCLQDLCGEALVGCEFVSIVDPKSTIRTHRNN